MRPTAVAASALYTIWIPGIGISAIKDSPPIWIRQVIPFKPLLVISSAYTSLSASMPKNTGLIPSYSFTMQSLSSSPFNTIWPSFCRYLKISVFAFSTPSLSPRFSRWQVPILVITQVFGLAIFARRVISPKSLIPISRTAISSSSRRRKTVRGRPNSLLKFPCVFRVRYFSFSTEAITSFVLVFPTLPVIPTTGIWSCCR